MKSNKCFAKIPRRRFSFHSDFDEWALMVSKAEATVPTEMAATEKTYSLVSVGGLRNTVKMTSETERKIV